MSEDSLTVKILIELREEIRQTNARLDARIDQTNAQMAAGFGEVHREIDGVRREIDSVRHEISGVRGDFTGLEIRAATRHTEHMAATRDLYGLLQDRFELRDRMERVETDIVELKKKVG